MLRYAFCIVALGAMQETSRVAQLYAQQHTSFADMAASLSDDTEGVFEIERIRSSETYRTLRQADSHALYNELLVQNDFPSLKACGLLLIQEKSPEEAYEAALQMVLSDPRPGSPFYGLAVIIVSQGLPDDAGAAMLVSRLSCPRCTPSSVAVVLRMLTDDDLARLVESAETRRLRCSVLALVVDEAGSRDRIVERDDWPQELQAMVKQLAHCPGVPRVTYLMSVEPKPPNFDDLLRSTLADESIDGVFVLPLLDQFYNSHRMVIEESLSRASPEKKAIFRRFVDRRRQDQSN